MIKAVRQKTEAAWTLAKKTIVFLCCWGLIFSLATISRVGVVFDYDETLVHSTKTYARAFGESRQPYSSAFWSTVNRSYDIESPKVLPYTLAWVFRLCGFHVAILTSRPGIDSDGLKKEWRHLVPAGRFMFASDRAAKHRYLEGATYLLFFGDSDSDMEEARQAHVFPVRIRRSKDSFFKDDYHPGAFHELVIPLSQY
jgi:acid phosphatase class B